MEITIMAIIYTIVLFMQLAVCENSYSPKYYLPLKMTCSTLFLIFAIIEIVLHKTFRADMYITFFALIFCWLGDFFLGFYNRDRKKKMMLSGIIVFAIAHLLFLAAMYMERPKFSIILILVPLMSLVFMGIVSALFHLKFGRLRVPVFVYGFFVSSLLTKGVYDIIVFMSARTMKIGIGSILFFVSDFSILFLYFYHFKKHSLMRAIHHFNLATYFYAIFAFIMAIGELQ